MSDLEGIQMDETSILQRLETLKRQALIDAMERSIPSLAQAAPDLAARLARQTLEDIQKGHNPDLEPTFRARIASLGISLN